MNLAPLFLPRSWRSCFLSTGTSRLTGPQGSPCPGLWSLFSLGFLKAPAEKEEFFFFFFLFYPETPPSSCSASFILVKCNSVLDTCAHHIIMSTLVCGEAFYWAGSAEHSVGHGDSSAPALLGRDKVPSGVWTHPLGALNPFPGREERGLKVGDAVPSPPHIPPVI